MTARPTQDKALSEPQSLELNSENKHPKKRRNTTQYPEEERHHKTSSRIAVPLKNFQPWAFLHLELLFTPPSSAPASVDDLTVRTHLTTALHQFLGLTGTAIPVDLLKVCGRQVWLRVPLEDMGAVVTAVSGWVGGGGSTTDAECIGWKVRAKGKWLTGVIPGNGQDLFLV